MKRLLVPMLLIFASHQATAQDDSFKRPYLGVQLQEAPSLGTSTIMGLRRPQVSNRAT
jgi:hypothetical protein